MSVLALLFLFGFRAISILVVTGALLEILESLECFGRVGKAFAFSGSLWVIFAGPFTGPFEISFVATFVGFVEGLRERRNSISCLRCPVTEEVSCSDARWVLAAGTSS